MPIVALRTLLLLTNPQSTLNNVPFFVVSFTQNYSDEVCNMHVNMQLMFIPKVVLSRQGIAAARYVAAGVAAAEALPSLSKSKWERVALSSPLLNTGGDLNPLKFFYDPETTRALIAESERLVEINADREVERYPLSHK
ncbi:hypothetical protein NE237_015985 [Protea cynaroides]|uniref:Uncharacterized protein n=1 Tax=Protea cynaroides TaxID=273540 RepID=A0A9Q0QRQ7_9MAGN|nr:hypothetical protein NE237_015985 [Protea cynaroides]